MSRLLRLLKTSAEGGQSMVEYALVLVLIAVVVVVVLSQLGTQIKAVFANVLKALGGLTAIRRLNSQARADRRNVVLWLRPAGFRRG